MYHRMEYHKAACKICVLFPCKRCGSKEPGEGWYLPTSTVDAGVILACDKCRDDYERCMVNAVETACLDFVANNGDHQILDKREATRQEPRP